MILTTDHSKIMASYFVAMAEAADLNNQRFKNLYFHLFFPGQFYLTILKQWRLSFHKAYNLSIFIAGCFVLMVYNVLHYHPKRHL